MESKKLHITLLALWTIPATLFAGTSIFFFSNNKVNFTFNGSNIELYIGISVLVLAAITFAVGYGCFRSNKYALYFAILYLLFSVLILASYTLQDDIVYLKNLVLPVYFTVISLFTIIFFKVNSGGKSA